jgi:uncharacterized membrane protein
MALTAPLLILYIPRTPHAANWTTGYAAYIYTEKIAAAAYGGAALTYLGFAMIWRARGLRIFSEPGQGLLLLGAWAVVDAIVMIGAHPIIRGGDPETLWMAMWWMYVFFSGMILLPLAGAWFLGNDRWWRLFYVALATTFGLVCALLFGLPHLMSPSAPPGLIAFIKSCNSYGWIPATLYMVILAIAVVADWRAGRRRHWTHWCGVVGWSFTTLWPLLGSRVFQ